MGTPPSNMCTARWLGVLEMCSAQEGVAGWGGGLVCICFARECAMGVSAFWSHVLEPVLCVRARAGSVLQQALQLRPCEGPQPAQSGRWHPNTEGQQQMPEDRLSFQPTVCTPTPTPVFRKRCRLLVRGLGSSVSAPREKCEIPFFEKNGPPGKSPGAGSGHSVLGRDGIWF